MRTPFFFRLWFAFCFLMALAIMVATVNVLLHPEWIGEFAGKIVTGYTQTTQAPVAQPAPPGQSPI